VLTTSQDKADAASSPGPAEIPVQPAPEPDTAKPPVPAPEPCTYEESLAVEKKVKKIVKKVDSCGCINISFDWETGGVHAALQSSYDSQPCTPDDAKMNDREEKLKAGLTQDEVNCLASFPLYVSGKRMDQGRKLVDRAFQKCPAEKGSAYWYSLMIEVNEDGKVLDIRPRKDEDQIPADAIECLKKALKGLSFPCLAGYQICPEYVIIE
jgi:hypothetical protein